jgi:hypothetical protein
MVFLGFGHRLNKLSSALSSFGFSKEAFLVLSMPMQFSIPVDVEVSLAPALIKIYKGERYRLEVISHSLKLWAAILYEEKESFSKTFRVPIVLSLKKEEGLGDYFEKFEPIGILNLTRGFGEKDWRIALVGLSADYKSKGFGAASYDWAINNFIPKLVSRSGEGGGAISDSIQTEDSKRMWIRLLLKHLKDGVVDPAKFVVFDSSSGKEFIIKKVGEDWFYDDQGELKKIWGGLKTDPQTEHIILKAKI